MFFLVIHYFQHRDTQATLAVLDKLDLDTERPSDEAIAKLFGYEDEYHKGLENFTIYKSKELHVQRHSELVDEG